MDLLALVRSLEPVPTMPIHLRLFLSLDHVVFRKASSPLDPVQLSEDTLPDTSDLDLTEPPDVVIDLSCNCTTPAKPPRLGVWWYATEPHGRGSLLPYFWVVSGNQPTVSSALFAQLDPAAPPVVLERFLCAASNLSIERTCHHVFWKAPESFARQLQAVVDSDSLVPEDSTELMSVVTPTWNYGPGIPKVRHILWLAVRIAGSGLRNRLRSLTSEMKWFVAFRLRSSTCL